MGQTKGNYPNTFYRVSLKAIIRNEMDEVLCVKEHGSEWSLPGGGIDHGETYAEALARELYEETAIADKFEADIIGMDTMFLEVRQAYLMWLVYEVKFIANLSYGVGVDGDEVAFINPHTFKDSPHRSERLIYKWSVDQTYNPHFGKAIDIHD